MKTEGPLPVVGAVATLSVRKKGEVVCFSNGKIDERAADEDGENEIKVEVVEGANCALTIDLNPGCRAKLPSS